MLGSTIDAKPPLADLNKPKDPGKPSVEFLEARTIVRRGPRGPYNKNPKPQGDTEAKPPSSQPPPARWTPVSAGAFIQALHCIPAGIEGNDAWLYTPAELEKAAPVSAEVLNDLVPADAYWLKLVVFAGIVLPIEWSKISAWKTRRAQKLAAKKPSSPAAIQGAAGPPAGSTNPVGASAMPKPIVLPGSEMAVAPGVILPK